MSRRNPPQGTGGDGGSPTKTTLATLGSSQGVASGTVETIELDTLDESQLSGFDTTTHTFTVPSDGNYLLDAGLRLAGLPSADNIAMWIEINGNRIAQSDERAGSDTTDEPLSMEPSTVKALTSGDTVTLEFFNGTTGTVTIASTQSQIHFSITRLSDTP